MGLSDEEARNKIQHMMSFIEKEGIEKAEEIDAKAEEEFNIEKGRLVVQQMAKIKEHFERKEKQVSLQRKIQSSNMLNQARLKVLKAREDHVQNVLSEARQTLAGIANNQQKYPKILEGLIAQGLCQLLESNVTVRCRQVDRAVVHAAIPPAIASVKEQTKKEVQVKLDEENFLSADCSGGVELYAQKGKIKVNNTLEARLEMIAGQKLPQIRNSLFGINQNRKFLD